MCDYNSVNLESVDVCLFAFILEKYDVTQYEYIK